MGPATEAVASDFSAPPQREDALNSAAPAPDATAAPPANNRPGQDFADGDVGGPDFWAVRGVASNDALNVRTSASIGAGIVGSVPNGTILRNLGCRSVETGRWCRVGSLADDNLDGWVNARFLRESGPPANWPQNNSRPPARPPGDGVPELMRRASGEYEIRYASGCTILIDARGAILVKGATCSPAQISRASEAVAAYRREQGL